MNPYKNLDASGLGYIAQYSRILRALSADRVIINDTGISAQTRSHYTIEDVQALFGVVNLFLEA